MLSNSLIPDPLTLWPDAVTRLDGEADSFAADGLKSQEVRALHRLSSVSLGMPPAAPAKASRSAARRTEG